MKKRNSLICMVISALILLSLISAFGASNVSPLANAASVSNASISAVQSGTTATSSITLGPSPNPIGQSISIDIRINNGAGIWGWTLSTVTWNPQVLNLTQVQEGSFLAGNSGNPTLFLWDSQLSWDNTNGLLYGGLSDVLAVASTSAASSGVLATLTFVVTGTGTSQIGIAGGNVRVSTSDTVGTNVVCNNATIVATLTAISSTPSPSTSTSPGSSTHPTSTPSSTQTASPTSAPEFSAVMILPIFIITLAAVLGYRLNKKKTPMTNPSKRLRYEQKSTDI